MLGIKLILPAALAVGCGLLFVLPMAVGGAEDVTEKARLFVAGHEANVRPLEVAAALAWWNANVTGKDDDFKRKEEAQNRIDEALADRAAFAELKQLKEFNKQGQIDDKLLAREIDLLYLQ
jgi:peptidyl-dipeptidase A